MLPQSAERLYPMPLQSPKTSTKIKEEMHSQLVTSEQSEQPLEETQAKAPEQFQSTTPQQSENSDTDEGGDEPTKGSIIDYGPISSNEFQPLSRVIS